jgi:glutamate synthase domain-containing protein 3
MSGGVAYVLDEDGSFASRCNTGLVGFDPLEERDVELVRALVEEHAERTGSPVADRVLAEWEAILPFFVKVMPHDYKRVLAELGGEDGHVNYKTDHPVSASGAGFFTTDSEEAA